LRVKPKKS